MNGWVSITSFPPHALVDRIVYVVTSADIHTDGALTLGLRASGEWARWTTTRA